MKLSESFSALDTIRRNLNAPLSKWSPERTNAGNREPIRIKLAKGIEITLDKVDTHDGLFHHEGEHVVIYIKDHTSVNPNRGSPIEDIKYRRKVHLKECQTIKKMKSDGRFDRYVVTNRRDNLYAIDVMNFNRVEHHDKTLFPCLNCLKELNFEGAETMTQRDRKELRANFDIEAFFENYSTFFLEKPKYTDKNYPVNAYVDGWDDISRRVRNESSWTCKKCKVDLRSISLRKWLHVHHINGNKSDNHSENLVSLCVVCHAAEPGHGHMHVAHNGRSEIENQRRKI